MAYSKRLGILVVLCQAACGPESMPRPDARTTPDAWPTIDARIVLDAPIVIDAPVPDAPGALDAPVLDAGADARIDAGVADAMLPGVTLSPAMATVTRGGTVTLMLTLGEPAPVGGAAILLETSSTDVTVPSSVTIPVAATTASFIATGVTVGAPVTVRARLGDAVSEITVRVVPGLVGITPGLVNILAGTTGSYSVTLDETVTGGPVTVSLSTSPAGIAGAPATVEIPNGSNAASFTVSGTSLGVSTLTAAIGNARTEARVRVFGLLFSEILYDVPGADDMREWIELYNATDTPVSLDGMVIQVAVTAGMWVTALELEGTVPAAGCVVVGGPLGNDEDAGPQFEYFLAADFSPDLGNAGDSAADAADGIQLVTPTGVIDNVIYGRHNGDNVTDEDGDVPETPDVGDAAAGRSIQRTEIHINGTWVVDTSPNPGDCSAIAK
jgi:hypothetical protein